ncbi:MAG: ABC transporter substrate-binding protein [Acidaminococcales bacterium]|jgi:iron complex transport system substrate-binding protein|nr:ABC transporter substrate-binding protein [Acidaminococcales bacterium]
MNIKKHFFAILFLALAAGGGLYLWRGGDSSGAAQAAFSMVRDDAGREVRVPERPKRVVVLSATHVDLFCAAGGKDILVGKPISQVMSDDTKAASANAKEIGMSMSPNTEIILSLNPDLIIGLNMPPHLALIPILEKVGIPMLAKSTDTYEQALAALRFYGELAGQEETARTKIAEIQGKYSLARQKSAGKRPPRSLILFGTPESMSMATKKSFTGDLLERLGGGNVMDNAVGFDTSSAYLSLSMEYVTKQNPEVIFLITHGSPEGLEEKFSREMSGNPIWNQLSAVKNGRLYVLPYGLFTINPGSRIGDAINMLADKLYGENR